MRLTTSSNWNAIAAAPNREPRWKYEIRKTASLSDALSSGTWIDVTEYVTDPPGFSSKVEHDPGQFRSDNITLTVNNIAWFDANIFNASASEYLELKVSLILAVTDTFKTSDVIYLFTGFIDKYEVTQNELADNSTFTAYTADDLGSRISAEKVNTQYLEPDVDGAATQGLVLPLILGLYVTNANVSSYVLKVGYHTIEYDYNTAAPQAKLDDGDWVALPVADGLVTLANGAVDQKITLYCKPALLPATSVSIYEYVVVATAGTTLPQQPYYGLTIKQSLLKLYEQIGLTTVAFDTLACNTDDGVRNVSFLDVPPMDASIGGKRSAIASDGTDLWIAIDKYVYKRTMSNDTYTQKVTLSSGSIIKKLMYNARNGELFIFYTNGANSYLRKYTVGSNTLSSATTIATAADDVYAYGMELIDYNYTGSSYEYAIIFALNGSGLKRLDCAAMTVSQPGAFVDTGITYTGGAMFVFKKSETALTSLKIFYARYSSGDAWNEYKEVELTTSSTWANNGRQVTGIPSFLVGAFDTSTSKIFAAVNVDVDPGEITYHSASSGSQTTVIAMNAGENCECIYSNQGRTMFTVSSATKSAGTFYAYSGTTLERQINDIIYTQYCSIIYSVDRFYGVGTNGVLFQYHTSIVFSVLRLNCKDKTIRDVITGVLQSYILIGKISSMKSVQVLRRGDDSGTIQTTGNSMALTVSNVEDITKIQKAFAKIDLIIVSNGTATVTYDGTTFGANVFSDARRLEISSEYIPTNLLRSVAKYGFQFFSVDHDKYTFPVLQPLVQYEPMDGASVTFSTTKIQKTASGLIVGQSIKPDASFDAEVLI